MTESLDKREGGWLTLSWYSSTLAAKGKKMELSGKQLLNERVTSFFVPYFQKHQGKACCFVQFTQYGFFAPLPHSPPPFFNRPIGQSLPYKLNSPVHDLCWTALDHITARYARVASRQYRRAAEERLVDLFVAGAGL